MSPVRAISLETQGDIEDEVMRRLFGHETGPPKTFGRYEVVGRLGAGAMGSVYLARDPELDREVAIKVLRLHLAEDRERLVAEAQAMARLSHPNVVSVFDVGEARGQVFVAMERIDGVNLRVWQEDERPWREVVRVYLGAARGLEAAHGAGVVHRDFKPDNVLIGRDGSVKVSDFGVASVLPPEALVETVRNAEPESDPWELATAGVGGTPAYMSPEQLNGLGSDPQSDQFSFCIALFEALAGYRPFIDDNLVDLIKRTLDGEQRPPPPSTRVPSGVWRALRRGLSAEPDQRFRSMSELCAELDRQLRPAWRRWWALAGVGVGLLSAVGGAAIYRHYQQATCTEHATEASRIWDAKRDGVRDGLLAAPAVFAKATWQQVERDLDRWTAGWQAERVDVCAATDAPAADRTRRVLCLEEQVRELDGLLSVLSTPDPVVTEHASRAVAGLGQPERCVDAQWLAATQPVPPDAAIQADVDAARATLARARALSRAGKDALALEVAREQSELAAGLDYAPLIAEASLSIGRASLALGDYKTAEAALVHAVAQANAAAAPRTGAQASIELLSLVGAHLERFEEGRTWSRLAAGYVQRLGPAGRALDARRLVSLAQVESRGRNLDETLRLLDEAHTLMSEIDASQMQWVSLWTIEATARTALGESATALELRERVARANEELYGAAHPNVAMARLNLGIAQARRGDFDGARAKLQSALELNAAAYGEDHPDNARILNNLANVAVLTGKTNEAEHLQLEAIALNQRAYGPNDKRLLRNLANLGLIQLRQGRTDEAEATLHSVVEGYEALSGPDHLDVAEALLNLSTVSSEKQDLNRTYSLLLRAKSIFDEHSPTAPGRGAALHNLANVTRSLGKPEQALGFAREAVELVQASHGPSNPEWAKARSLLALLLLETGDVEGTRELMDTLLPWASSEAVDADTAATISFIHADLLWTAGNQEEARAAARRGLEAALPDSPVAAALDRWLDTHP